MSTFDRCKPTLQRIDRGIIATKNAAARALAVGFCVLLTGACLGMALWCIKHQYYWATSLCPIPAFGFTSECMEDADIPEALKFLLSAFLLTAAPLFFAAPLAALFPKLSLPAWWVLVAAVGGFCYLIHLSREPQTAHAPEPVLASGRERTLEEILGDKKIIIEDIENA